MTSKERDTSPFLVCFNALDRRLFRIRFRIVLAMKIDLGNTPGICMRNKLLPLSAYLT